MQFLSETPSGRSLVECGFRFPSSQVVVASVVVALFPQAMKPSPFAASVGIDRSCFC